VPTPELTFYSISSSALPLCRRNAFYSKGRQYRDVAYTYAAVLGVVAELVREGWLFEHRVERNIASIVSGGVVARPGSKGLHR
jgi:hypothetical protein